MTDALKVFDSPQFGQLRTAGTPHNPLFCLADVCRVLGLNNSREVKRRLNEGGVIQIDTPTKSGIQPLTFINEPNLYRTIFRSDKPEAVLFQDWVCEEVLPSIRKTGGYETKPTARKPSTITRGEMEKRFEAVRSLGSLVNLTDATKLTLCNPILEAVGLPKVPYTRADDAACSCTRLLKDRGIDLSAQAFNAKMATAGMLRRVERPDGTPYNVLVGDGLLYGRNDVCQQDKGKTQPVYLVARFDALLKVLGNVRVPSVPETATLPFPEAAHC